MNENIGNNIKILAKILGYFFLIAGALVGIIFLFVSAPIGLIIIGSAVVTWLSFWLLYGLGHIIETLDDIRCDTMSLRRNANQTAHGTQSQTNSTVMNDLPDL
jgi:hypothetical protein